jgi:hypothetical protein
VKSKPPFVKSERPPSVKTETKSISLLGSSVGSSSIAFVKSELMTEGMVGSYYGSRTGSLETFTSYGGGSSAGSNGSGAALPPALSGQASYGGSSSVGSNQTPRRSQRRNGSLSTLQYAGGSAVGSTGESAGSFSPVRARATSGAG